MEIGKNTSEFKAVVAGLALTGAQILGIDIKEIVALASSPDAQTVIDLVRNAHSSGQISPTLLMWGGIGAYVWSRTVRKGKK